MINLQETLNNLNFEDAGELVKGTLGDIGGYGGGGGDGADGGG